MDILSLDPVECAAWVRVLRAILKLVVGILKFARSLHSGPEANAGLPTTSFKKSLA